MEDAQGKHHYSAFHRIVTQEATFETVDHPAWIHTTLQHVEVLGLSVDSGHRLLLSMLPPPQFRSLDQQVSRILGSPEWTAVYIIDAKFAAVGISPYATRACYHGPTVERLLAALETAVHAADREFPAFMDSQPKVTYINTRTHSILKRRLLETARR